MNEITWPSILGPLTKGDSLTSEQAAWAMGEIMDGRAAPAQFGAFVASLRTKGETVDEILGLVQTMRGLSLKVETPYQVVDTCGTGGDRSGSINISTIAALVAAGAGAKVAKHGNRAATSICGSADLLEELGVRINLPPEGVAKCIDQAGIGFCFAPVFHPSMRHAASPRKDIGVATVFNFLGPLTNPAGALHQAIGVADEQMAYKMLEVLKRLGSVHVLMYMGSDGLDELTTTGPSSMWELREGEITERVLDPVDLGIKVTTAAELQGGDKAANAAVANSVLSGKHGAQRDVVALNAAAALVAADMTEEFSHALEHAYESIDSGKAAASLERLIDTSQSFE
ncbi:MAG TPA: anthranilate phosphoribosyltransferase [Actinomycetota bacterium]|nr:anthranilate phosphoribosyltransferase [Actinomycetota bacterium]